MAKHAGPILQNEAGFLERHKLRLATKEFMPISLYEDRIELTNSKGEVGVLPLAEVGQVKLAACVLKVKTTDNKNYEFDFLTGYAQMIPGIWSIIPAYFSPSRRTALEWYGQLQRLILPRLNIS